MKNTRTTQKSTTTRNTTKRSQSASRPGTAKVETIQYRTPRSPGYYRMTGYQDESGSIQIMTADRYRGINQYTGTWVPVTDMDAFKKRLVKRIDG